MRYGPNWIKHRKNSHPIIHCPTSEQTSEHSGMREQSKQCEASSVKRAVQSKRTSERCEQMSKLMSEWFSTSVSILGYSGPQCHGIYAPAYAIKFSLNRLWSFTLWHHRRNEIKIGHPFFTKALSCSFKLISTDKFNLHYRSISFGHTKDTFIVSFKHGILYCYLYCSAAEIQWFAHVWCVWNFGYHIINMKITYKMFLLKSCPSPGKKKPVIREPLGLEMIYFLIVQDNSFYERKKGT